MHLLLTKLDLKILLLRTKFRLVSARMKRTMRSPLGRKLRCLHRKQLSWHHYSLPPKTADRGDSCILIFHFLTIYILQKLCFQWRWPLSLERGNLSTQANFYFFSVSFSHLSWSVILVQIYCSSCCTMSLEHNYCLMSCFSWVRQPERAKAQAHKSTLCILHNVKMSPTLSLEELILIQWT